MALDSLVKLGASFATNAAKASAWCLQFPRLRTCGRNFNLKRSEVNRHRAETMDHTLSMMFHSAVHVLALWESTIFICQLLFFLSRVDLLGRRRLKGRGMHLYGGGRMPCFTFRGPGMRKKTAGNPRNVAAIDLLVTQLDSI